MLLDMSDIQWSLVAFKLPAFQESFNKCLAGEEETLLTQDVHCVIEGEPSWILLRITTLKLGEKRLPLTLPQVIKKNPSEPTQIINLNADSLRDLIRLRPKIANALARRHIHEHEAKQASKKMLSACNCSSN